MHGSISIEPKEHDESTEALDQVHYCMSPRVRRSRESLIVAPACQLLSLSYGSSRLIYIFICRTHCILIESIRYAIFTSTQSNYEQASWEKNFVRITVDSITKFGFNNSELNVQSDLLLCTILGSESRNKSIVKMRTRRCFIDP